MVNNSSTFHQDYANHPLSTSTSVEKSGGNATSEVETRTGRSHSFDASVGVLNNTAKLTGNASKQAFADAHITPPDPDNIGTDTSLTLGRQRSFSNAGGGETSGTGSALDNPDTRKALIAKLGPAPDPPRDNDQTRLSTSISNADPRPLQSPRDRSNSTSSLPRETTMTDSRAKALQQQRAKPLPSTPTRSQSMRSLNGEANKVKSRPKGLKTQCAKPLPGTPTNSQSMTSSKHGPVGTLTSQQIADLNSATNYEKSEKAEQPRNDGLKRSHSRLGSVLKDYLVI